MITTEKYKVIGTSMFPLLKAGYLVPLVSDGRECFTLGTHSRGTISIDDVDIASQNCAIVKFESSVEIPESDAIVSPSNDETFCLPHYVVYFSKKAKEDVLKDCETPEFKRLESPGHLEEYSFFLLRKESLKTWLDTSFNKYKKYIEKQLREYYGLSKKDESKLKNINQLFPILQTFATHKDKKEETLVLRFASAKQFEEEKVSDEWIRAIASLWGFNCSVDEWREKVAKKLKELVPSVPTLIQPSVLEPIRTRRTESKTITLNHLVASVPRPAARVVVRNDAKILSYDQVIVEAKKWGKLLNESNNTGRRSCSMNKKEKNSSIVPRPAARVVVRNDAKISSCGRIIAAPVTRWRKLARNESNNFGCRLYSTNNEEQNSLVELTDNRNKNQTFRKTIRLKYKDPKTRLGREKTNVLVAQGGAIGVDNADNDEYTTSTLLSH